MRTLTLQWLEEVYAEVNDRNDGPVEVNLESCNWFNVIGDFLFRELRDSPEVKRSVLYVVIHQPHSPSSKRDPSKFQTDKLQDTSQHGKLGDQGVLESRVQGKATTSVCHAAAFMFEDVVM